MLDEALLADIAPDLLRPSQGPQFLHAGLDKGELLRDKVPIGHCSALSILRYVLK